MRSNRVNLSAPEICPKSLTMAILFANDRTSADPASVHPQGTKMRDVPETAGQCLALRFCQQFSKSMLAAIRAYCGLWIGFARYWLRRNIVSCWIVIVSVPLF
jgi:hypothetical protein